MNTLEILARQTEDAYQWVNKLIQEIPQDRWEITPDILESNVSWQLGHLIMSYYYHSIMCIAGHQADIFEQLPIKTYAALFTYDALPKNAVGKTEPEVLLSHLNIMERKSLDIIRSLTPESLESKLEPSRVPHPIAHNKFEALDWNIKHTMWHCGQIGLIKRVIHERFDFGLKKAD